MYQYDSLNDEDSTCSVRILTLLPGKRSAMLRIRLNSVPFNTQNPPVYEALSYTWGSTKNPAYAYVTVGETGDHAIAITQNLANALPYLRYIDRPRALWIDAICVNQMDLVERSQQVQLMGDIYRLATRVIAWVGPEFDDSSYALETLDAIGSSVEVDWNTGSSKPANSDEKSKIMVENLRKQNVRLSNRQYNTIMSFFISRIWFQRLWVQQELRLANENAIIKCGSAELSWNIFGRSIFVLQYGLHPDQIEKSLAYDGVFYERLLGVFHFCKPVQRQSFHSRINFCQRSLCSDPRDRVYALLSVHEKGRPHGVARLVICPDYEAPVSQVYQQTTRELINQDLHINLLSACELQLELDNKHSLPSWVPDFSRPRLNTAINSSFAAGETFANWDYCASDVLRVRGKSISSLQTTQSFGMSRQTSDILGILRQIRPPMGLDIPYLTGSTILDAYCDALNCGAFADATMPPLPKLRRDTSTEILRLIWNTELDSDGLTKSIGATDVRKFLNGLLTHCDNRTICTTEQGYIVLAPKCAQPGDQVCVLLGCRSSMLLRPTGSPAGSQWQVVGECYVAGLENGEALAGPLPEGCRKISVFAEGRSGWLPGFQNIATKEIQWEDPRFDISEYPEVGSRVETPRWNEDKRIWENQMARIRNGKDAGRLQYPWQEENLKKRGVVLEDFYLI